MSAVDRPNLHEGVKSPETNVYIQPLNIGPTIELAREMHNDYEWDAEAIPAEATVQKKLEIIGKREIGNTDPAVLATLVEEDVVLDALLPAFSDQEQAITIKLLTEEMRASEFDAYGVGALLDIDCSNGNFAREDIEQLLQSQAFCYALGTEMYVYGKEDECVREEPTTDDSLIALGRMHLIGELVGGADLDNTANLADLAARYPEDFAEALILKASDANISGPYLTSKPSRPYVIADKEQALGVLRGVIAHNPALGIYILNHLETTFSNLDEDVLQEPRRTTLLQDITTVNFTYMKDPLPEFNKAGVDKFIADFPAINQLSAEIGQPYVTARLVERILFPGGVDDKDNLPQPTDGDTIKQLLSEVLARHRQLGALLIKFANSPELVQKITECDDDVYLVRSVLGWSQFDFGDGTVTGLSRAIDRVRGLDDKHAVSRHAASEVIRIKKSETPEADATIDMIERLERLSQVHFSASYGDKPRSIKVKLQALQTKAAQANGESQDAETAQKIAFQIDRLAELIGYDFGKFPHGIAQLTRYDSHIGDELTQLLLSGVRHDYAQYQNAAEGDIDAISEIVEMLRHQTAELFHKNPDLSKQDKQAIKKLLSTRAFEPLFANSQTGSEETQDLQFVPARGLLLEASGYLAKVCWANVGDINTKHPNFDALAMVQPNEAKGRSASKRGFVGASLLIHAESKEGPLLIVRGFNPAQSLVNRIDVPHFFSEFADFIRELAKKDGRKAAIVIDREGSGGSATNRPRVYDHLVSIRPNLKPVAVSPRETEFNTYDISEDTYLL